ncbi:MAG: glycerate kinase [Trueperaceae bacterium]|nr:MAG: glycerate kinase [Trueperaceae bacterium]
MNAIGKFDRTSDALPLLKAAFAVGVQAANPETELAAHLPDPPEGRLLVIGAGKAAASMARVVERHYEGIPLEGMVITRYGHALSTDSIAVIEAGHPVPDRNGISATKQILRILSSATERDLVLCLLSGGGSALLTAPTGVTLEQQAALTAALLRSGADIVEMNCVRKHLSRVKGGWLAAAAAPARLVSLILSDVVGDDLSTVASGPTVPDPTTYAEALDVLVRYQIDAPAARAHFERGVDGRLPETPKPGDPVFTKAEYRLVASNQKSLEAVTAFFESRGIAAHFLSSTITGEAREVAKVHAAIASHVLWNHQPFTPPCALISGGETTVTVRGKGKGGRNSEFALALALAMPETQKLFVLAADSDGIDGSEENAGAFVTPQLFSTLPRYRARQMLLNNDSYTAFAQTDHLFVTGPTHTNVNDFRILLLSDLGAG